VPQTRQIALGPAVAGIGAILLLASLFFDWFSPGLTAWTAFEALDLLLAALAVAALTLAAQEVGMRLPGGPLPGTVLLPLALVALVIVVSQILNHPPAGVGRDPEIGLWLALGAVVLLAAGALIGSSYVSVVQVVARGDGPAATPGAPPEAPPEPSAAPTEPLSRSGPSGGEDEPPPPEPGRPS